MKNHLKPDQMLESLYGVPAAGSKEHLDACPACRGTLAQWELRRRAFAADGEIGAEALAKQARLIRARAEERPRRLVEFVPALAAVAATLVLAFVAMKPSAPRIPEISDEQLFAEVLALEQSVEPRAAVPIRDLFISTKQK